jgi:hypothetical protein
MISGPSRAVIYIAPRVFWLKRISGTCNYNKNEKIAGGQKIFKNDVGKKPSENE